MSERSNVAGTSDLTAGDHAHRATRPRRVVLREADLATPGEAHERLARRLEFPDHYGHNMDALADCLGDISRPTRIVLVRDPRRPQAWFDDLEEVVRESAQRSCYLGCTIR